MRRRLPEFFFECCGDKAPGPDGMTMAFLQHNWATLKGDVMRMFAEFFSTEKFVASLNSTFIALFLRKLGQLILKTFDLSVLWDLCISFCRRFWPGD